MTSKQSKQSVTQTALTTLGLILLMIGLWMGIKRIIYPNRPNVPREFSLTTVHELADQLDRQIKAWEDNLFLETYAVTYRFDNTSVPTLSGAAHFKFVGKRVDWLGKLVGSYDANHVIIDLGVDINQRKVTELSYSHGEPFGYRTPLNISNWPRSEEELLQICQVAL